MKNKKMYVGADPVSAHTSKARQNKGITLIALVITIIVMLVLVGVTIQMAINGGLFENAGEATGKTQNAINAEQQLANGRIKIGEVWYDSIDDYLKEKPSKDQGINFEELFKTATKHPDQEDTNDIGIAEDGSAVNLDLWLYVLNSDGTSYFLNSSYISSVSNPGYSNLDIVDGKIQGKVPMYIKEDGESDFFPVTNMNRTFYGCTNLTTAPEIPSSVTDMHGTFYGCTNLTTAPEIPSSVTIMTDTFFECTKLTGELIINANPTYITDCLHQAAKAPGCYLVLKGDCPRERLIEIAGTQGLASTPINITIGK